MSVYDGECEYPFVIPYFLVYKTHAQRQQQRKVKMHLLDKLKDAISKKKPECILFHCYNFI